MRKMTGYQRLLGMACIAALAACSDGGSEQGSSSTPNGTTSAGVRDAAPAASQVSAAQLGVELENMDTSVRPQDDFFRYVNGGWLDANEIPADRSRWGSFDELNEAAQQHVLEIVREMAQRQDLAPGSDEQKLADLFRSFMDEAAIEAAGLEPLRPDLQRIDSLQSHEDLLDYWSDTSRYVVTGPLGVFVGQDQRQSDQYISSLNQSGLGLPDRDYYLSDDERSSELREQYRAHVQAMFELAGLDKAAEAAERVLALETRIAQAHWTRVQNRDRNATYNRMDMAELAATAPGFDWPRYLEQTGIGAVEALIVRQPDYLSEFAAFYREFPVQDWQHYQRFHLLREFSPYLTADFVNENFDFYNRTLSGQPEIRSRERRGVSVVENALGFIVGRLYVDRHFQPEARARMDALVDNLKVAFRESIDELEWMSADTKREAQDKLSKFTTKIGYPDVWRDYSCVEIRPDDLLGNVRRADVCEYQRILGRLGQPVDRDEWQMTPQTVNAYYSSTMNEIVFPAAILQPPFFNVEADDAVNYGAIGGVIGHEITHGFDDQGRHSDGDGNLRGWWTDVDAEQFSERAQRMIDQYSSYEPIEGMAIQGALALGENIADLGGLTVSFRAWQHSLGDQPAPVIEGFTGAQRFFLGWGQVWRIKFREEALRRQLITGPHSPGKYRVLGVLSNMPEFYEAFGVEQGDGMFRPEEVRVKIW